MKIITEMYLCTAKKNENKHGNVSVDLVKPLNEFIPCKSQLEAKILFSCALTRKRLLFLSMATIILYYCFTIPNGIDTL